MNNQQKSFILSSFRRMNIPITSFVHKFCDKIIMEGWTPPLGSLKDVDLEIKLKYQEFSYEQR